MYEMKIIIGTLLARFRLHLVDEAVPTHARRRITYGPRGGVPMVLARAH